MVHLILPTSILTNWGWTLPLTFIYYRYRILQPCVCWYLRKHDYHNGSGGGERWEEIIRILKLKPKVKLYKIECNRKHVQDIADKLATDQKKTDNLMRKKVQQWQAEYRCRNKTATEEKTICKITQNILFSDLDTPNINHASRIILNLIFRGHP